MTKVTLDVSGIPPENAPFIITGGGFTVQQNEQLLGRFTIEVPPGSGHEMPVTVLASTEREAFAQIAALSKGFAGMNAEKAKLHEDKLMAKGWQFGGVSMRGNKRIVWLNKIKYEMSSDEEKIIGFFSRIYKAPKKEMRSVNLQEEVPPREAVANPDPQLAEGREYRKIFGNAEPHVDRAPDQIDAFLDAANETFPGIRERLAGGDRTYQRDVMTYGEMMEQLVAAYYDAAALSQKAKMEGSARTLLGAPQLTREQIREKLLEDSPVDANTSLQLLSMLYEKRALPAYSGDVAGLREAREAFGDVDTERQGENVLNLLEELDTPFTGLKESFERDDDFFRNHLTYKELMNHLVEKYYDTIEGERKGQMEKMVKDLLGNAELTSGEIREVVAEDSAIGENNSLQLLTHIYTASSS